MLHPPTFLSFLVSEGLLSREAATTLNEECSKTHMLLGQLMLRQRHVTLAQMVKLLEAQADAPSRRLGELAVAAGYLDEPTLQDLLEQQSAAKAQHPLELLRSRGLLSDRSLSEATVAYIKLVEQR